MSTWSCCSSSALRYCHHNAERHALFCVYSDQNTRQLRLPVLVHPAPILRKFTTFVAKSNFEVKAVSMPIRESRLFLPQHLCGPHSGVEKSPPMEWIIWYSYCYGSPSRCKCLHRAKLTSIRTGTTALSTFYIIINVAG